MTEPTELLPCPFCGSQARRSSGGAWFGTGCNGSQHCPAYLRGLTHRSQAEADAVWNTRTPQPTQAQAGAVPMSHEDAKALVLKYGIDPLHLVLQVERHHGIKNGGQHGAD